MKPEGLIMRWSEFGPKETMDRLQDTAKQHGMTVFARIDHSAYATDAHLQLQPREVLFLGNPLLGTPLMRAHGTLAIDLPLKAMVWQDDAGKTCLAYYDPLWLATRHGVSPEFRETIEKMGAGLRAAVQGAVRGAATGDAKG